MFILGVDPALNNLGYSVIKIDNRMVFYIESGVIKNKPTIDIFEKMKNVNHKIQEIIKKFPFHSIGIESSFVKLNPSVAIKLGMVKGLIYSIAIENKISIDEYSPQQIKKTITGNGNANKDSIISELTRIIPNISFETNDASDATAIAITHAIFSLNKI